jgi:Putative peptidoglycan-binding domain-containing protein
MLQVGSHGAGVVTLQERLRDLGYNPGQVDGVFGPNTKAAVLSFQRAQGLAADGIVGPRTQAALDSVPAGC